MRKLLMCLLAFASIFGTASAKAATVTVSDIQTWGQAVVDYLTANPSIAGLTSAEVQSTKAAFAELTTSTQISGYTNVYNNVLQSNTACSGIGTYPSINQTNLTTCSTAMTAALATAGYSTPGAVMGAIAALSKAMGAPLTIPGTTTTVPIPQPTTPITTTTAATTTTTTKAATTTTAAATTTTTAAATTTTSATATTTTSTTTTTVRRSEQEAAAAVVAAATTAISAQVQRATTIQQAVTIINVLSSIGNPRAAMGPQRVSIGQNKSGMAAGGIAGQWNAWMNVSRASIDNTYRNIALGADTRFDGNVDNWIGGVDYGLDKDWVVGASVGFDKTKIDTFFNNGNLTSKGTMIAPYVSYQVNKVFSVDAILGYADGDSDILSNLFTPTTGKQDFTRNFGAINVSATEWIDSWQFTGKVSYIAAEEQLKSYRDSLGFTAPGQTNRMQQIRFGGQVGYWADGIMPYAGLTYSNDIKSPTSVVSGIELPKTRDAYTFAVGINVFAKDLMGSLTYSSERGRSNSKNDILMGSLGYRF